MQFAHNAPFIRSLCLSVPFSPYGDSNKKEAQRNEEILYKFFFVSLPQMWHMNICIVHTSMCVCVYKVYRAFTIRIFLVSFIVQQHEHNVNNLCIHWIPLLFRSFSFAHHSFAAWFRFILFAALRCFVLYIPFHASSFLSAVFVCGNKLAAWPCMYTIFELISKHSLEYYIE